MAMFQIEYYLLYDASWLAQIQQKKNCPNQMDWVQDISNPVAKGSMLIYLPTSRRELNNVKALVG